MKMHAKTVEECWRIARRETEAYQRALNRAVRNGRFGQAGLCQASLRAADRVALQIRYGRRRR